MAGAPLIVDEKELKALVADLRKEPAVALDTEASSFHRYKERVCLIQLSTRNRTWLVDPIAIHDLSAINALMTDKKVETVIHDADYDLRLLKRQSGIHAVRVWDTMVAAELVNEPNLGLAALLKKYVGVELDKKFQKADWSMRPLKPAMLEYAAKDTAHLLELRDHLAAQLKAKDREAWAAEEFAFLVDIPFNVEENDEPGFLRVKGAKLLKPAQLAILRELHAWREKLAERLDRAPFMVLGNETMLDLCKQPPASKKELGERKGVGDTNAQRNGDAILKAIERGRAVPKEDWPRVPKPLRYERDADFEDRVKRLRAAREEKMKEFDLPPGIICNNNMLAEIARKMPRTAEELKAVAGMRHYQVKHFGAALLAAL
ncbi:MAG: ribonuclease D [Flavobacteriales bacterium]|nr:MAG: ribonuclease D [Flavobacteriales bacterium]